MGLEALGSSLDGVRVVEFGNLISGPFCGKVLAELGTDAIKVKPPHSDDPIRSQGQHPRWWEGVQVRDDMTPVVNCPMIHGDGPVAVQARNELGETGIARYLYNYLA